MPRKTDFSVQLNPMGAPASPNGELLVQAGKYQGQAAAIQGERRAKDTLFVAGMGAEIAKGYLEAQVEKETKDTLSNLDTGDFKGEAAQKRAEAVAPKAQASILAANSLAEQVQDQGFMAEELSGSAAAQSMEVQAFRNGAQRYVERR